MKKRIFKFKIGLARKCASDAYDKLCRNENSSGDQLATYLMHKRQELVAAAFLKIPFYRSAYQRAGFDLGDMEQEGWFEKLPIVTKRDLKEHFDEFVNPELKQFLKVSTTGGSTGTPTKTGYDSRVPEEIYSWRLQRWFGVNPWDDHAYIWRDTRKSRVAQFKNALMWWPTKHLKLDASFLTEEAIAGFLKHYRKLRPTLLQGYVGAVVQVAEYVLMHPEVDVTNPYLKCIWTTSAPLSNVQRKILEKAFGAKVCDQYGSCEIRWIAQQCAECGGLHVNVEHVNIEFVDSENYPVGKGEYGKTLLTDLENYVFPLIRYENGDRGRWLQSDCPCGRVLPLIDSVKGRQVESFVLPSGKIINGEFLTTIFDANPEIARGFRVVQHKDLSVTVECIPSDNGCRNRVVAIVEDFASKIGGEVPVNCKFVDAIAHDRGKLRFVVREV